MEDKIVLDSLTTMLGNVPVRADEDYDEMSFEEKLENTIGECILILSGSLHSGELDIDIMKLVLAKLMLARTSLKDYQETLKTMEEEGFEVVDPYKEMLSKKRNIKDSMSTFNSIGQYVKAYELDYPDYLAKAIKDAALPEGVSAIGFGNKRAIGKIKLKP